MGHTDDQDRTPIIVFDNVSFGYPESRELVFNRLSLEIPPGVTSLVGQNATGKSTLMLLAGGVALPDEGSVLLCGVDTRTIRDETARQRYASLIHQNMEFETSEPIGELLRFVFDNGYHEGVDTELIDELAEVFELGTLLSQRTQEVSKGGLQRTLLAFCLLYGSRVLMMDEPIFALEEPQKERAMRFLTAYAERSGVSILFSAHELDITARHSDHTMLFTPDAEPVLGPTDEVFTRQAIEAAYDAPFDFLKRREALYRFALNKGFGEASGRR